MDTAAAALARYTQEVALKETIQETMVEQEVARQAEDAARARAAMPARPAAPSARACLAGPRGGPSCLNRAPASSVRSAPVQLAPRARAPFGSSSTGRPSAAAGRHSHYAPGLEPRGRGPAGAASRAGASAAAATGVRRPQPFSESLVLSPP